MRISDWSSDVCASDLPQGARSVVHLPDRDDLGQKADHGGLSQRRRDGYRHLWRRGGRTAIFQAWRGKADPARGGAHRSEEPTSALQSLMRISYAVFCLKKQNKNQQLATRSHYIVQKLS